MFCVLILCFFGVDSTLSKLINGLEINLNFSRRKKVLDFL